MKIVTKENLSTYTKQLKENIKEFNNLKNYYNKENSYDKKTVDTLLEGLGEGIKIPTTDKIYEMEAGIYKITRENAEKLYIASNREIDIYGENILVVSSPNNSSSRSFIFLDGNFSNLYFGTSSHNNTNYSKNYLNSLGIGGAIAFTKDVLTKTNTTAYTPTGNYNPCTKLYADTIKSDIESQIGDINTILATLTTPSEVTE